MTPVNDSSSTPPLRVSLRHIAETLGISHSTVSLALRDHPRISAAVREKVRKTATEMGYRPDPALTALAHYRKGRFSPPVQAALAWLNCWEKPETLRKYREFDGYWRGAETAARRFGYCLEEFVAGGNRMSMERLEKVLVTRNIQGILIPPHPREISSGEFRWQEFSLVRFGRSVVRPQSHLVASDHVSNTLLAFEKMQERGYRRIGFVTGMGRVRGLHFLAGFEMARLQGKLLPPLVLPEIVTPARQTTRVEETARRPKLLSNWLKKNQPDAILTDVADLHEMLMSLGVRVPEEIGLAAESVLDGNATAGINQRSEEIGRVAMLLLISLINDNERGVPDAIRQVLVGGSWVDGSTLPSRS